MAEAQGLPAEHCHGQRDCGSPGRCVCAYDTCAWLCIIELLADVPLEAATSLVAEGEKALTSDDPTRIDAFAAKRGITRQETIVLCLLAARPSCGVLALDETRDCLAVR